MQQYQVMREALEQEEGQALRCVAQEEHRVLGSIEKQLDALQGALISSQTVLNTLQGMTNAEGASQYQDQAFIMVQQAAVIISNASIHLFLCALWDIAG